MDITEKKFFTHFKITPVYIYIVETRSSSGIVENTFRLQRAEVIHFFSGVACIEGLLFARVTKVIIKYPEITPQMYIDLEQLLLSQVCYIKKKIIDDVYINEIHLESKEFFVIHSEAAKTTLLISCMALNSRKPLEMRKFFNIKEQI